MRDFTIEIYKKLLHELQQAGYTFVSFAEYLSGSAKGAKTLILRHDVDRKPKRSLETAKLEKEMGIRGTYYFRVRKNEIPEEEIGKIAALGHEIGYHYEDLEAGGGDIGKAVESFKKNLARLRKLVPVKTVCMHGSPRSKHDNRLLWERYDYRDFNIIGEPYFDIDFSKVFYLSDTGRRWDGEAFSIRDKVRGPTELYAKLHSTRDIIAALEKDLLSDKIMLTVHPQRWNDGFLLWLKELVWQNIKNLVKYFVAKGGST